MDPTATVPQAKSQRWSEVAWIASLLCVFVASIIAGWISIPLFHLDVSTHRYSALQLSATLFLRETVALVVLVIVIRRYLNVTWADIGLKKPRGSELLLGLAVGIGYLVLYVMVGRRLAPWLPHDNPGPHIASAVRDGGAASELLAIVVTGFYSPAIQELVFRGLLFGGLVQRTNLAVAILLSAIIFGAAHLMTGPKTFLFTSIFGVIMAYLYFRLRSLTAPIVAHVVTNVTITTNSVLAAHGIVLFSPIPLSSF